MPNASAEGLWSRVTTQFPPCIIGLTHPARFPPKSSRLTHPSSSQHLPCSPSFCLACPEPHLLPSLHVSGTFVL
ncbi:hypothetical protein XENTR_v10016346 [Xenopus tropicalis]|nr:hypothetical protein XENTR_v10016346 [Xenopus tropicalis]